MTIYLPEEIPLFRQAFDATCQRILSSEQDATFYALLTELITNLREHPLLQSWISTLDDENEKRKQEFDRSSLEDLEECWKRLWRYHRRSPRNRRQLARIKRMITAPNAFSFRPLYARIQSSMWEFRCQYSSFYHFVYGVPHLYRSAQAEQRYLIYDLDYFYPKREEYFVHRKVSQHKLAKEDMRLLFHKKIPLLRNQEQGEPRFKRVEQIFPECFSQKSNAIEQKFLILGQNNSEKRQNMLMMAEVTPMFCWERFKFLYQCHTMERDPRPLKWVNGDWASIRETAWQAALERCQTEVLIGAQRFLTDQLIPNSSSSCMDLFMRYEDQIHRRDFEKYLQSLKNHIHVHLFKMESMQQKVEDEHLALPGTQKDHFVIDLAREFWKTAPLGKQDEAYDYYLVHCPYSKILKRDRWNQIVRERKLDRRPSNAKTRGPGKKTCKK